MGGKGVNINTKSWAHREETEGFFSARTVRMSRMATPLLMSGKHISNFKVRLCVQMKTCTHTIS